MRKLSLFILLLLVFSGCNVTLQTKVNLRDILEAKTKTISSDLYVEVAGCNSYEDSREPSSSVIEAQQTIPGIFKDATYIECFSKKIDSVAHFKIPVVLDKDNDGKLASESHVNIVSNKESLLVVAIPPSIKAKMDKVKRDSFGTDSFDLKVNIKVNNDTGKEFPFKVISAYVEGQPFIYGELSVKEKAAFVVTLSDVSVSNALENGNSLVLMH